MQIPKVSWKGLKITIPIYWKHLSLESQRPYSNILYTESWLTCLGLVSTPAGRVELAGVEVAGLRVVIGLGMSRSVQLWGAGLEVKGKAVPAGDAVPLWPMPSSLELRWTTQIAHYFALSYQQTVVSASVTVWKKTLLVSLFAPKAVLKLWNPYFWEVFL